MGIVIKPTFGFVFSFYLGTPQICGFPLVSPQHARKKGTLRKDAPTGSNSQHYDFSQMGLARRLVLVRIDEDC